LPKKKFRFETCKVCGRIFIADLKCFVCAAKQ